MNGDVARTVVAVARENGIALVSAGLAFYVFNSLLPLLVFVVIGVTSVGWLEPVLAAFEPVVGSDVDAAVSVVDDAIGEGTGRRRAALIAGGILAWSAFTTFQSVNAAFGHVYGVRAERSILGTVRDTCLILATVVLAVALLIAVHVGLAGANGAAASTAASVPLLTVGLFGVFAPMFYRFAPPEVTIREALPGAVLAAISWTACAVGFRVYLVASESVRLYGVVGGVMLLLTWLYVGCLALLVGIVLNAVLADRVDADDRWVEG